MRQSSALDILKTGQNVFLTGSAGSGKTYTLNQYIDYLRARRVPVAVTASTGIAATHMNGTTIHSWSGIGIKDELTDRDLSNLSRKQFLADRLKDTAVLIIDEISMLHAKQINLVSQVLKHVRKNDKAFGGIQVVVAGDFFSCHPSVVKVRAIVRSLPLCRKLGSMLSFTSATYLSNIGKSVKRRMAGLIWMIFSIKFVAKK